jgi:predicted nucleic acid-binding protein
LDSGIFVAFFDEKDSENKHQRTINFLNSLSKFRHIKLVSSTWALTETTKVLVREKKIEPKKVRKFIEKLFRTNRLGGQKFLLLPAGPQGYDFDEFFYDIQEKLLTHEISIADTIHLSFMSNNEVDRIITFDSDFDGIKKIKSFNPDSFVKYTNKKLQTQ